MKMGERVKMRERVQKGGRVKMAERVKMGEKVNKGALGAAKSISGLRHMRKQRVSKTPLRTNGHAAWRLVQMPGEKYKRRKGNKKIRRDAGARGKR